MNTHWVSLWERKFRNDRGPLVVSYYAMASSVDEALAQAAKDKTVLIPFLGRKLKKRFLDHRFFKGIHDPAYSNRCWKMNLGKYHLVIYKLKKHQE